MDDFDVLRGQLAIGPLLSASHDATVEVHQRDQLVDQELRSPAPQPEISALHIADDESDRSEEPTDAASQRIGVGDELGGWRTGWFRPIARALPNDERLVGDGVRRVDEGDVDSKPVDADRREDATRYRPALVADFMSRVYGAKNGSCDVGIDLIDHTLQVKVGVVVRGSRSEPAIRPIELTLRNLGGLHAWGHPGAVWHVASSMKL